MDDGDGEPEALRVRRGPARRTRVLGHDHRVAVVGNLKRFKMVHKKSSRLLTAHKGTAGVRGVPLMSSSSQLEIDSTIWGDKKLINEG